MQLGKAAVLLIISMGISLFTNNSYADDSEKSRTWNIKYYQGVRLDTSNKRDHTYLTRAEISLFHKLDGDYDITIEFQPFAEARYLWDREEWERSEGGVEVGFHLTEFAYIGESCHYAWLKNNDNTPEFETRLEVDVPFIVNSNGYKINLLLIEEYTFATDIGEATRNDIAAYLKIPVLKYLELSLGWRHIDRVHDYDSDQIEMGGTFIF